MKKIYQSPVIEYLEAEPMQVIAASMVIGEDYNGTDEIQSLKDIDLSFGNDNLGF